MKEFNLSDKIIGGDILSDSSKVIDIEDVKEFIRLLKCNSDFDDVDREFIDKLAGDKLVEEKK